MTLSRTKFNPSIWRTAPRLIAVHLESDIVTGKEVPSRWLLHVYSSLDFLSEVLREIIVRTKSPNHEYGLNSVNTYIVLDTFILAFDLSDLFKTL